MSSVSGKICREIQAHFILCSVIFSPRNSGHLWDNAGKCGRVMQATDDSATGRVRFAYRINKLEYGNTLIMFNTYWFSTATVVTGTHLNVTWYVHSPPCCLSCLHLFEETDLFLWALLFDVLREHCCMSGKTVRNPTILWVWVTEWLSSWLENWPTHYYSFGICWVPELVPNLCT
jgi:hypothetical protein